MRMFGMGFLLLVTGVFAATALAQAPAPNPIAIPAATPTPEVSTMASGSDNDTVLTMDELPQTRQVRCSCIEAAKAMIGYSGETWGNAADMVPNLHAYHPGVVIVTDEGGGHVAIGVTEPDEFGWVLIRESNYMTCALTERWLNLNTGAVKDMNGLLYIHAAHIKGFWHPDPWKFEPPMVDETLTNVA